MFKSNKMFFATLLALPLLLGYGNGFAKNIAATEKPKQQIVNKKAKSEDANLIIDINTADVVLLQKVKGIGKKKAEAIVEYRKVNGKFNSLDDLLNVKCRGISKKWLEKVKGHLTV